MKKLSDLKIGDKVRLLISNINWADSMTEIVNNYPIVKITDIKFETDGNIIIDFTENCSSERQGAIQGGLSLRVGGFWWESRSNHFEVIQDEELPKENYNYLIEILKKLNIN